MGRLTLIAARNLWQHKRRTLFLGSAIAAVTMLLVLLTSASNGVQDTMLRAAATLTTGHVNVGGFFKVTSGQATPAVVDYQAIKQRVRRELPEARAVVDRLRGWGKVISPATSMQVGIAGVDIENDAMLAEVLSIVSGRLANLRKPRAALIFAKQAKRLEVRVGDMLTISAPTMRGANNAIDVQVVAIAKEVGLLSQFNIFANKQAVRDIYLMGPSATGAIQIYLDRPDRSAAVAQRLRGVLARAGHRVMEPLSDPFWMKFPVVTREAWTGQKLDVTTWKDELSFLTWIITAFDAVTGVVIGILLVIIVVGVMNTLWMTIRERTNEIGTLRAIGMSRGRVLLMFLLESAILSVAAAAIGLGLGCALALALDASHIAVSEGFNVFLMSDTLRFVVAGDSLARALLTIVGLTTLFSLYPAYRATKLRPVTAIHHVG